ncbi:MAG TPA: ATP-binding protein [Pyrinomonadaceae bacterium]|nr:ATP-binding protein [Pyrinomonadaceae bacterium]
MKRNSDLKLIITFTALTFLLTVAVVIAWEKLLLPPFYSWVDSLYPGEAHADLRWKVQQRVEHFVISVAVDMVVVTLLLRVVRRQQREAAASEARYRALFEHSGAGIAFFEAEGGRLAEANDRLCELLGLRQPEMAGRTVSDLLRPRSEEDRARLADIHAAGPGPREGEVVLRTEAGADLPVFLSFDTLPTAGGSVGLLVARDLSARWQLKEEKEEMRRQLYQTSKLAAVGELAAGVAHEINNPLNGIINFAQLLKDEPAPRSDFERQMIDGVIEEGERIARIVRELLAFARHDEYEPGEVSVASLVGVSLSLFGRQLEREGVRVEVDVPVDLPPVRGDGPRLRQVVVNMISNARHALREAEGDRLFRVSARSARSGGRPVVCLEFYDTGVGVPPENLGRLFDPFFTTRRDSGGTGLGLSISFRIVRDHGGRLRVESEPGRYTRFTAELPAAEVDAAPAPATEVGHA